MRRPSRESLNLAARRLLRRGGRRLGLDVVPSGFYSPIVDVEALPAELWERPAPMPGLQLDLERQLATLTGPLAPYVAQLDLPLRAPAPGAPFRPYLENPNFGPMDAHVLYAMLRHHRPRRVLELGSGFSTLIIARALSANGQAGARHVVVDPHPSPLLAHAEAALELRELSAAALAQAAFAELGEDDVLFVDTSHTVRPGGEVVRLVLEVLPALAPGVIVHFHDFFRPFEYPRLLYERFNVHWQEHYLVQAFLAYNPGFEVLLSHHALWRLRREQIAPMFGGLREGMEPSSLWLRRVSGPERAALSGRL